MVLFRPSIDTIVYDSIRHHADKIAALGRSELEITLFASGYLVLVLVSNDGGVFGDILCYIQVVKS